MKTQTKLLLTFLLSVSILLETSASTQSADALTPKELQTALAAKPSGTEAEKLADRTRALFGKENLLKGTNPKVDELTVAWALEAPNVALTPRVASDDGMFGLPLVRVGNTDVYAAVLTLTWGAAMKWHYEIGMQKFGGGQLEVYTTHPDSIEKPGVPKGTVTPQPKWESKLFPGTTRDWWVYVPAQYTPDKPACVMIFQDGQNAVKYTPVVFDNLIAKGEMPVTVGIFITPGTFSANGASNRSFEYDTLSDRYARFLLEEILPEIEKTVKLRHDAASRAIAGISSGGICAFTVAWERPNEFHKVLSWVGSFTNIAHRDTWREGGHNYPALIRKSKPVRPIRALLQDGENDLDNANGNWPLANLQMDKALKFSSYDYKFEWGHGFHSDRHGRAILPDSLRWLWRDYRR